MPLKELQHLVLAEGRIVPDDDFDHDPFLSPVREKIKRGILTGPGAGYNQALFRK